MKVDIPYRVSIVELEFAPFGKYADAKNWARSHGVIGVMSDTDTGGKGEIAISANSLDKMLSGSAVKKSVTPAIHYSALMRLRDIIRESFVAEIHPDYKKINGSRSIDNEVNPDVEIAVLYGAVSYGGLPFRAKTTLKLHRDANYPTKAYSYEISNIEVLTGIVESMIQPNVLTSMDVNSLLKSVRKVNGELFIKPDFAYGTEESRSALRAWLTGRRRIALVTGGHSYERCGAKSFLDTVFAEASSGNDDFRVTRLATPSANPQVDTVQQLLGSLPDDTDAIIAVGGGTAIDTAKLLNLAFSLKTDVRSTLSLPKSTPIPASRLLPSCAIPTTAGTGAEATRFAVCYDGETKYSVDFAALKPSDVALIPEFAATQSAYQRASTEFDAYAQAVESLWANGATEESRAYANRALSLIKTGDWCRASYWAGRAIDISRTTAAHAFSYYLTSHYGVPHGAAVYMIFPYICRANGYPEYLRHSARLKTLREFAAEKQLDWDELVDALLANVNPARLGNNPKPISKESFYV